MPRLQPTSPSEQPLTGTVQNQKAAQGEERLARSIEKGMKQGLVRGHYFRWTTLKRGTVGYKELDELVFTIFGAMAISVKDRDWIHKTARAKNQDSINELFILEKLRELGISLLGNAIKTVFADKLKTQTDADREARKLGVLR